MTVRALLGRLLDGDLEAESFEAALGASGMPAHERCPISTGDCVQNQTGVDSSPRRPNPIGLTVVELLARHGHRLHVRGVDMLDGTPILDLKPYLSSVPAEALRRGWLAEAEARAAQKLEKPAQGRNDCL